MPRPLPLVAAACGAVVLLGAAVAAGWGGLVAEDASAGAIARIVIVALLLVGAAAGAAAAGAAVLLALVLPPAGARPIERVGIVAAAVLAVTAGVLAITVGIDDAARLPLAACAVVAAVSAVTLGLARAWAARASAAALIVVSLACASAAAAPSGRPWHHAAAVGLALAVAGASVAVGVVAVWAVAVAGTVGADRAALASRVTPIALGGAVAAVVGVIVVSAVTLAAAAHPTGHSPAEILTGLPLPAASVRALLLGVAPSPFWPLAALASVPLVGAAAVVVRRRGGRWPRWRVLAWVAGALLLAWATGGGAARAAETLVAWTAIRGLLVALVAAPLLVAGAPLRLLGAVLVAVGRAPRTDGSRGPLEWAEAARSSVAARILRHGVAAGLLLATVLAAALLSPLVRWSATSGLGADVVVGLLLLAGAVAARSSWRASGSRAGALAAVLLPALSVAAIGLTLLFGSELLVADWFGAMGWELGATALELQRAAGVPVMAIGWGSLAVVGVIALLRPRAAPRGRAAATPRPVDEEREAYARLLGAAAASRSDVSRGA